MKRKIRQEELDIHLQELINKLKEMQIILVRPIEKKSDSNESKSLINKTDFSKVLPEELTSELISFLAISERRQLGITSKLMDKSVKQSVMNSPIRLFGKKHGPFAGIFNPHHLTNDPTFREMTFAYTVSLERGLSNPRVFNKVMAVASDQRAIIHIEDYEEQINNPKNREYFRK